MILAPMFLISNVKMVLEASKSGIASAIPALNFRTDADLRQAMEIIRSETSCKYGINLIVNKSNFKLRQQLQACLDLKPTFVITSLGNPKEVIEKCHKAGILVFCDVVDSYSGKKASFYNPDGLIAVNNQAGGHAGRLSSRELVHELKKISDLPIISAGGVGNGLHFYEKISEGACGVSVGTIFIASEESPVSPEYKKACIEYGAKDIVMTTKLSGTPCTVINTPYVKKTGTRQNPVEAFLNKNKQLKKIVKGITFYKGMQSLRKAAFSTTYQTVWCAGPVIEFVDEVLPVQTIVGKLIREYYQHSIPQPLYKAHD